MKVLCLIAALAATTAQGGESACALTRDCAGAAGCVAEPLVVTLSWRTPLDGVWTLARTHSHASSRRALRQTSVSDTIMVRNCSSDAVTP